MPPLQVCIEVNIAGEEAKHGVAPDEAVALAVEVAKLPNVVVRGLMCVAKADSDDEELRVQFQTMQKLLADLNAAGVARMCCLWRCPAICLWRSHAVQRMCASAARFSADGNQKGKTVNKNRLS